MKILNELALFSFLSAEAYNYDTTLTKMKIKKKR
jgi:hypothetical protein